MFRYILLILSFALYTDYAKAEQYTEYYKWYSKDGVLYDIAQTKDRYPVMISIYSPGKDNANMVVSYFSYGACDHSINTMKIDTNDYPAQYTCIPDKKGKMNHYVITDANSVNYMIDRLTSSFTVALQGDIIVWVGNFATPEFGAAPNFW
jgi:hypothetical protein